MRSSILAASLLLALTVVNANDDEGQEFEVVTCGSAINLVHVQSRYRLHSHEVAYGSGSRQQSVTAVNFLADPNSLWVVRGEHGKHCPQGTQIKNGDTIRLSHLNTKRNLHSHFFESPLSKQQEVSGFGEKSSGDTGDEWIIEMKDEDHWKRGKRFRLKHKATGAYLHSHSHFRFNQNNCGGNCPIQGQQEVTAWKEVDDENNWWKTAEGIYYPKAVEVEA